MNFVYNNFPKKTISFQKCTNKYFLPSAKKKLKFSRLQRAGFKLPSIGGAIPISSTRPPSPDMWCIWVFLGVSSEVYLGVSVCIWVYWGVSWCIWGVSGAGPGIVPYTRGPPVGGAIRKSPARPRLHVPYTWAKMPFLGKKPLHFRTKNAPKMAQKWSKMTKIAPKVAK